MGETGYTGKGMTIAIIDTGVNYLHKDMVQNPDTMKHTQAQMQELVESIFDEKGIPEQSLKVSGLGVSDAISGKCVYVIIPHLGIQRSFYIDEDTHKYTRECHTMTLKLNDVNL